MTDECSGAARAFFKRIKHDPAHFHAIQPNNSRSAVKAKREEEKWGGVRGISRRACLAEMRVNHLAW